MSDEIKTGKSGTDIHLDGNDGAIIFRENGVEMLLPDIDLDAILPKHLAPLMAFAMTLGDEKKLQAAIDDMNASIETMLAKKEGNE
jgi:hypothetical protein